MKGIFRLFARGEFDDVDKICGWTKEICNGGVKIVEAQRACIVVVNKWDLVKPDLDKAQAEFAEKSAHKKGKQRKKTDESQASLADFAAWVQENLFFLDYAPVIFTSAKSGLHLDRLLDAVRYVADQLKQKIPTSILNRTLHDAIERRQPVSAAGHRLKFFYATQVRQAPPTFLLFINRKELFSDAYKKYLSVQLRTAFGYEGCPLIIVPKARPQVVEPIRKFRKPQPGKTAKPNSHQPERRSKKPQRH